MKQNEFNRDDAIRRFQECHLGHTPAEMGYTAIDEYKDCYVYAKKQKSLDIFFKFERNSKAFNIILPVFSILFLAICVWIIVSPEIPKAGIIILWLISLFLFAVIGYVLFNIDCYLFIIQRNVTTVKKL
ncbi:MAG: hypothetical protein E7004_05790 [Alphaproteobacteria bacterium]|nr:hypothetical protein [Alphaproteobacteria bacterium]